MSSSSKSGKGGGGSKSYDYYGTIFAMWHVGQMDELTGIEVDQRMVWSGSILRTESTNPVEITIPGRGIYRHYWGTRDESTVDPVLQAAGNDSGHAHPTHRGFCKGIFEEFLFGRERTQAPAVRIRGKRAPVQSIITGTPTALIDGQANPFVLLAELLTDEWFGLGLSNDFFSEAGWQAAAEAAELKAAWCYVSPFLAAATSVRSLAADLFALCDGFLRTETGTGLCEAGMFTAPEDIVGAELVVLSQAARIADPKIRPQTWDDVKTRWNLRCRDRDYNFKARSLTHDDPGALARVEDIRPEDLQQPAIVRFEQALAFVREWGRRFSTPGVPGSVAVRGPLVETLRPGEHASIDLQTEPGGSAQMTVCRVLEIERKNNDEATVRFDAVRSIAPVLYTPIAAVEPPAEPAIPCITNVRLFSPPSAFNGETEQLAVLAARPAEAVIDFALLYSTAEDGPFDQLGVDRSYAVRGALSGTLLSGSSAAVSVELLDSLDRELFSSDPGVSAAANDEVLMILFKITDGEIALATDGRPYFEIFSVTAFAAGAPDFITVDYLRERRGTIARHFYDGDEVWFIRRSNLPLFAHAEFATLAANQDPAFFDFQPGTIDDRKDGCDVLEFQFAETEGKPRDFSDLFYFDSATVTFEFRNRAATVAHVGFYAIQNFQTLGPGAPDYGLTRPQKRYRHATQSGTYVHTEDPSYYFVVGGTDSYDATTGVRTPLGIRQHWNEGSMDWEFTTEQVITEGYTSYFNTPWFTVTYDVDLDVITETSVTRNYTHGSFICNASLTLSDEDTQEDAFLRAYPSGEVYGAWDGTTSFSLMFARFEGYAPFDATQHTSFKHRDVQFRPHATGLSPSGEYVLKVDYERRTHTAEYTDGGAGPWVASGSEYYPLTITETGEISDASIIKITNDTQGYDTRVASTQLIRIN